MASLVVTLGSCTRVVWAEGWGATTTMGGAIHRDEEGGPQGNHLDLAANVSAVLLLMERKRFLKETCAGVAQQAFINWPRKHHHHWYLAHPSLCGAYWCWSDVVHHVALWDSCPALSAVPPGPRQDDSDEWVTDSDEEEERARRPKPPPAPPKTPAELPQVCCCVRCCTAMM